MVDNGNIQKSIMWGAYQNTELFKNYSIIVATLPEPTVRPPSLLYGFVIVLANRDKMGILLFLLCE